jgi:hypothetical protein
MCSTNYKCLSTVKEPSVIVKRRSYALRWPRPCDNATFRNERVPGNGWREDRRVLWFLERIVFQTGFSETLDTTCLSPQCITRKEQWR